MERRSNILKEFHSLIVPAMVICFIIPTTVSSQMRDNEIDRYYSEECYKYFKDKDYDKTTGCCQEWINKVSNSPNAYFC
ncbi:MAG: hypothetical protein J7K71_04235 [Candidatus Omnitrophica bacterium]|nr:hypothetical protein [Candidatus Omnitrophota bacterium]